MCAVGRIGILVGDNVQVQASRVLGFHSFVAISGAWVPDMAGTLRRLLQGFPSTLADRRKVVWLYRHLEMKPWGEVNLRASCLLGKRIERSPGLWRIDQGGTKMWVAQRTHDEIVLL